MCKAILISLFIKSHLFIYAFLIITFSFELFVLLELSCINDFPHAFCGKEKLVHSTKHLILCSVNKRQ